MVWTGTGIGSLKAVAKGSWDCLPVNHCWSQFLALSHTHLLGCARLYVDLEVWKQSQKALGIAFQSIIAWANFWPIFLTPTYWDVSDFMSTFGQRFRILVIWKHGCPLPSSYCACSTFLIFLLSHPTYFHSSLHAPIFVISMLYSPLLFPLLPAHPADLIGKRIFNCFQLWNFMNHRRQSTTV